MFALFHLVEEQAKQLYMSVLLVPGKQNAQSCIGDITPQLAACGIVLFVALCVCTFALFTPLVGVHTLESYIYIYI